MKPLAKLSLIRQRLYKKSCSADHDDVPFQEASADFYDDHGNYFVFYCILTSLLASTRSLKSPQVLCKIDFFIENTNVSLKMFSVIQANL